jgi:hypothetical protein
MKAQCPLAKSFGERLRGLEPRRVQYILPTLAEPPIATMTIFYSRSTTRRPQASPIAGSPRAIGAHDL